MAERLEQASPVRRIEVDAESRRPAYWRPVERKETVVEKLLLTAEEAAQALGVGRTRVYELMAGGVLTSVKIGASRRVPVDALREYVARLTGEAA